MPRGRANPSREEALEAVEQRITDLESQLVVSAAQGASDDMLADITKQIDNLLAAREKLLPDDNDEAGGDDVRRGSTSSLDPIPNDRDGSKSFAAPKDTPYLLKELVPKDMEHLNYSDPESFINDVQSVLSAAGVPESKWIRIIIGRFNRGMRDWGKDVVKAYEDTHREYCPYEHFEEKFRNEYVCPSSADSKINKFNTMKPKKGEQPAVFLARWETARREAGLSDSDKLAIASFRDILAPRVEEKVAEFKLELELAHSQVTLSKLIDVAKRRIYALKLDNYSWARVWSSPTASGRLPLAPGQRKEVECSFCKSKGHSVNNCRKKR
eukprot:Nk52_evm1s198 gene=Nk52_evmTU1s198